LVDLNSDFRKIICFTGILLSFLTYSQDCWYITKSYETLPDSFFIGRMSPSPPYNSEIFGIPESSSVKFKILDLNDKLLKETDYCLLEKGSYQFNWGKFIGNSQDFPSGIYYIEMLAIYHGSLRQLFTGRKRIIIVK